MTHIHPIFIQYSIPGNVPGSCASWHISERPAAECEFWLERAVVFNTVLSVADPEFEPLRRLRDECQVRWFRSFFSWRGWKANTRHTVHQSHTTAHRRCHLCFRRRRWNCHRESTIPSTSISFLFADKIKNDLLHSKFNNQVGTLLTPPRFRRRTLLAR